MEEQKRPRRKRKPIQLTVQFVPTQEGFPQGDSNPYRYMDEEEREALFMKSLVRILRDTQSGQAEEEVASPSDDPKNVQDHSAAQICRTDNKDRKGSDGERQK